MIKHTKTFYENSIDALHYAVSDKVSIVVIGVILTLISTMEHFDVAFTGWGILINIILIILIIFESGYSSKIVEETINGSTNPPSVENVLQILKEGVKEIILYFSYLIIVTVLVYGINAFGALYPQYHVLALLLVSIISALVLFFIQMAIVYRAHKQGDLKEGFNFKGIFGFCRKLGILGCIFFYIATFISQTILVSSIFNLTSLEIVALIKFILKFTLAPISLIFSLRLLALQGKLQ